MIAASEMSSNAFNAGRGHRPAGHVLRAAHPFPRKPGASVVNVSAPQLTVPMSLQAPASAAKAGVNMLTRI